MVKHVARDYPRCLGQIAGFAALDTVLKQGCSEHFRRLIHG